MDTSQYMSMFLEESMDNLQTLNEALLQLEQEPNNVDKLNEIFRVAHTIKGMAATMGFSVMAELTHKMEDVLTGFRNGDLRVTENVVTVLFKCLDALEQMVNNISEDSDVQIPIHELILALEGLSEGGKQVEQKKKAVAKKQTATKKVEVVVEEEIAEDVEVNNIALNEYDINVIKQAKEKGYNSFEVIINLSENTLLKSARAFLIFKTLEDWGEIIKSIPSTEDIENEDFDYQISLVFVTIREAGEVQKALMGVSEVTEVIVTEAKVEILRPVETYVKPEVIQPKVSKNVVDKRDKVDGSGNKETPLHKKAHQSVRVELDRLDKFMNMVSELVIHRTRLEQISNHNKITDLTETLEQVGRTTSDLQDLVMKIRMLPVDSVFNRFPRLVRDLSLELGKEMELIIQGADTELDRTVIDEIGEPLLHLIRNAADHGIESSETRIANGKDPVGKIKLIAYQEGTKAIIRVEDDGAGINVDRVKAKAEKIGINTDGMSDADIRNLIFAQGFSTVEKVTDISGRGVGMDVVKTKIASLGGTVDVISDMGKGSAFIIRLPLTLQIIQALLVTVGDETMAISLGYIDRVIEYKEDKVKKTNNKEVIIYNGNVIPLIRLNEKLSLKSSGTKKYYIVIVKVGEATVGLLVDSLLGQQEIVIKALGKTLKNLKEYIGATILGDGLVTLILDVAALI
ncbi:MAG: chemotaxis protein CheA [Clostridiaceae bacterium]|nr:chemotaxis protein CheA [Clostridiaceae bacterium]